MSERTKDAVIFWACFSSFWVAGFGLTNLLVWWGADNADAPPVAFVFMVALVFGSAGIYDWLNERLAFRRWKREYDRSGAWH